MKHLIWLAVIVLVFVSSWYAGSRLQQRDETSFQLMDVVPCQPLGAGCEAVFSGSVLQFRISSPVVAMRPFVTSVATQADIREMYIQFRMRDMDMGIQRYKLVNNGNGLWQSEAVLPVCGTGRSDWVVTLAVRDQETWWHAEFDFAVSSQPD